ncbi:integrase catalytic domain-containing protein [Trichonephila clavipes]|nr:integrase catalytic domain-containing protein [Trichonephila clavipes]
MFVAPMDTLCYLAGTQFIGKDGGPTGVFGAKKRLIEGFQKGVNDEKLLGSVCVSGEKGDEMGEEQRLVSESGGGSTKKPIVASLSSNFLSQAILNKNRWRANLLKRKKQNQLKEIDNQIKEIITDLEELEKEIEDSGKYLEKAIRISCQIDLKLEFSLSENSKILVNASNSESMSMSKQTVNLLKFDLPNFSGALEDWISFKQIFVTTIHENSELSDLQKLQYLKSCVVSTTNALIVNNVTVNLHNFVIQNSSWPHLESLQLADSKFHLSSPVEMLLGADLFPFIMLGQSILGPKGPCALNSKLGWLLSGVIHSNHSQKPRTVLSCHATIQLAYDLQKFWEIESLPDITPIHSSEELYTKTVSRTQSGRYMVDLPFKEVPNLGDSETNALKRFYLLESKLSKNPNLKEQYHAFMQEYIELNHMEPVPKSDIDSEHYFYLLHHGVVKEDSTTTKLRVVFDASAKGTTGHSLNDFLEIGPKLQPDLFKLLVKFRSFLIALTGDIAKIQFLKTYVDDFLGGSFSIDSAKQLVADLNPVLSQGGFTLRKWASNAPAVIQNLPEELKSTKQNVNISEDSSKKILGNVSWDDQVPDSISKNWEDFSSQIDLLKSIGIPRYLNCLISSEHQTEIHGFCDGSGKAYAAVVYLRTLSSSGDISVNFVAAKTRVNPLKHVTLPRIELCAAYVLAQLCSTVIDSLPFSINRLYLWSDCFELDRLSPHQGKPIRHKSYT